MKTSTGKIKASKSGEEQAPVWIDPNVFYRAAHIEAMLGVCFLVHLREAGLRAIGDWYSGKSILESYDHAWQDKKRQRVSAGKEEKNDADHAEETEDQLEETRHGRAIQSSSGRSRSDELLRQMEEVG